MKKDNLTGIYNSDYAESYNERFLLSPFSKTCADFELATLQSLIQPDITWLDAGCGTGYFLSRFPDVNRAGLDLSPDMILRAQSVNPDVSIREGDFRVPFEEWNNKWLLLTCMWIPYTYVDTVKEVEQVITNFINWVKPGGTIFLPVMDIEDLRFSKRIDYKDKVDEYGGTIYITGYTWTWHEESTGVIQENMILPHVDHMVNLFDTYFDTVEVVQYPPYQPGWHSRKAILAKGKRTPENYHLPTIINRQEVPGIEPIIQPSVTEPIVKSVSNKQLLKEVGTRMLNGKFLKAAFKKIFS